MLQRKAQFSFHPPVVSGYFYWACTLGNYHNAEGIESPNEQEGDTLPTEEQKEILSLDSTGRRWK